MKYNINNITLNIRYKDDVLNVTLHKSSSILRVKHLIYKKYNIRIKRQLLYYNGICLKNNMSVISYNLHSLSKIEIKQFDFKGGDNSDPLSCKNGGNQAIITIVTLLMFILLFNGFFFRTTNLINYAILTTIPAFFVFCKTYKQLGTIAFSIFIGYLLYMISLSFRKISGSAMTCIFIASYILTYIISIPRIYRVLSTPFILSLCDLILTVIKHFFIIAFIFLTISYVSYGIVNSIGDCKRPSCAINIGVKVGRLMTIIYYAHVIVFSVIDFVINTCSNIRHGMFLNSKLFYRMDPGFLTFPLFGINIPYMIGIVPSRNCMYNDYNGYKMWMYMPFVYFSKKSRSLKYLLMLFFPGVNYCEIRNAYNNNMISHFGKTFIYGLDKHRCNKTDATNLMRTLLFQQYISDKKLAGANPKYINDLEKKLAKIEANGKDGKTSVAKILELIRQNPQHNFMCEACSPFIMEDLYKFSETRDTEEKHKISAESTTADLPTALYNILSGNDLSLLYTFEAYKLCWSIKKYNFWKNYYVMFYGVHGVDYENLLVADQSQQGMVGHPHTKAPKSAKKHAMAPKSATGHAKEPKSAKKHAMTPESATGHAKAPKSATGHAKEPKSAKL